MDISKRSKLQQSNWKMLQLKALHLEGARMKRKQLVSSGLCYKNTIL